MWLLLLLLCRGISVKVVWSMLRNPKLVFLWLNFWPGYKTILPSALIWWHPSIINCVMLECVMMHIYLALMSSDILWTRSRLFIWLFDNCPLYHGRDVCSVQKTLNLYSCRFTVPCSSILANGKYMLKINSMPELLVTFGGVVVRQSLMMSNNICVGWRFALCHGRWAFTPSLHFRSCGEPECGIPFLCPSTGPQSVSNY